MPQRLRPPSATARKLSTLLIKFATRLAAPRRPGCTMGHALRPMGGWSFDNTSSFGDTVKDLERVLTVAKGLRAKHTDGRYARYLDILREAASFEYPRILP